MTTATLNGRTVSRARVSLGRHGLWFAGLDLIDDAELEGAATLVVGGVTCVGFILAGGVSDQTKRASYNVVGGAGGWGRVVPARGYANDAGVTVGNVLTDLAAACGETFAAPPSVRLGPHYTRRNAPAHETLNGLLPQAWHVGLDGVTRAGVWPESTYSGKAPRVRIDPGARLVELATEDLTGLVPGVVVDGNPAASDVEWVLDGERLSALVWYAPREPARRLRAYAKIFDAIDPNRAYRGAFEFRVVTQSGERFNLQPVRTGSGMPDLLNVPVRPGVAGFRNTVTPGEQVVVQFLDGDPSRPVITNHDAPDQPGWMPLSIEAGGPGALGVARVTDPVVAGAFSGTIVSGSVRVKAVL